MPSRYSRANFRIDQPEKQIAMASKAHLLQSQSLRAGAIDLTEGLGLASLQSNAIELGSLLPI
jgi:hypothetical protein